MKRVEVEWVDSMTLEYGGWIDTTDLDDGCMTNAGMRHTSIGYLAGETEDAIALAQSRNAADSDRNRDTRIGAVQIIPRVAVVSMEEV